AQIAQGKGRRPKPFILAEPGKADAIWRSNRNGGGNGANGAAKAKAADGSAKLAPKLRGRPGPMPDFVPPELAKLVDRPPQGSGWGHEIKFDGYRMQLRAQDGEAQLRTRKGLNWTDKFREIAEAGEGLPDGIV